MKTKKQERKSVEIPTPGKKPGIELPIDPEEPILPEVEPDLVPDEDPFITPPEELPAPGEGP
jgi:hypothetical protein